MVVSRGHSAKYSLSFTVFLLNDTTLVFGQQTTLCKHGERVFLRLFSTTLKFQKNKRELFILNCTGFARTEVVVHSQH